VQLTLPVRNLCAQENLGQRGAEVGTMGAGCPITPSTKKDRSKLPQVRLRLLFSRLSVIFWVPARERLTQVARMCAFRVAGRPAGVSLPQSTCEGASNPPLPRSGSCLVASFGEASSLRDHGAIRFAVLLVCHAGSTMTVAPLGLAGSIQSVCTNKQSPHAFVVADALWLPPALTFPSSNPALSASHCPVRSLNLPISALCSHARWSKGTAGMHPTQVHKSHA
jgi:hypothetical protein